MGDDLSITKLRSTWESAAPGWAKWEQDFSAELTHATDVLLDMAAVGPGQRVLDLACGAGSQSIQAAKRIGPDGHVVASDISGTMLEHVRERAAVQGLNNIETVECAAEELERSQRAFDAAICRLGLMLFSAPGSALGSVLHILKPGARFAALVFTTPDRNPFMAQPMQILLRHADKVPPGPGQPGIFALGGDNVLRDLLGDCGFVDIETATVRAPFRLSSATEALAFLTEAAGAYRAVVADLDPMARAAAWAEVKDCLGQFEGAGGLATEHEFLIGSGARPA